MVHFLKDRTVLVVGGSSGIGRRVAERAAEDGARLIIVGRNADRLAETAAALGGKAPFVATIQVDAHDHAALEAAFQSLPPVDHAVSMVGDVMGGGFLGADLAVIRHVIESKFFTNVRLAQLLAPQLRDGGSLVFTSGTGGRAQDACASYVGNLGINALVEGLAVELAPRGVRVNAVSPTWTLTPFWRDVPAEQIAAIRSRFENTIPLRRLAEIDELADAYLFLMKNGFITGQHVAVDGGIMLGG
ncbi:SDR family NAD(P)-dependent oxidoreductase [Xylophilus sp.]|uniref:SDR family NAD(P)-dependent oxidoreductase n=1 Tax=Xylophilus sp. TaxID=2653893 RepID=UPI0013BCD54B|nr:SDR family oxidoreductase [Xylophilus sp.]KAF1049795.1 MAG: Glucose 1-dehydrogenase [Xylophilus sp.]